jgi:hypothetical protein
MGDFGEHGERGPGGPGDQVRLTGRDILILQLVVRGHTNREIGTQASCPLERE